MMKTRSKGPHTIDELWGIASHDLMVRDIYAYSIYQTPAWWNLQLSKNTSRYFENMRKRVHVALSKRQQIKFDNWLFSVKHRSIGVQASMEWVVMTMRDALYDVWPDCPDFRSAV